MRGRAGLRFLFMCLDLSFLFFCQLLRIERLEWHRLRVRIERLEWRSLRVTALTPSTCLVLLATGDSGGWNWKAGRLLALVTGWDSYLRPVPLGPSPSSSPACRRRCSSPAPPTRPRPTWQVLRAPLWESTAHCRGLAVKSGGQTPARRRGAW